jgi:hypothetical protein
MGFLSTGAKVERHGCGAEPLLDVGAGVTPALRAIAFLVAGADRFGVELCHVLRLDTAPEVAIAG